MTPQSPIIVLDSGLGGLTVVRAMRVVLPRERIVYFGDTARLPYGSKTAETVTTFVRQIIHYLRPMDPKHVLIACNTATALSLPAIRAEFPGLSISGVVEPGAKAAVIAAGSKQSPVIGVIATEATVRSRAYDQAILRRRHHARLLLRATPLLVPMIEEGRTDADPVVDLVLRQYLFGMIERNIDVLVLGCTHYPILRAAIAKVVGSAVAVIDSAEQCAEDVARRLKMRRLLRLDDDATHSAAGDRLECFVTDDPPRFARLAERFLGVEIDPPTWVAPDELYTANPPTPVRVSA